MAALHMVSQPCKAALPRRRVVGPVQAREAAQEVVRRAEENLQAAKAKAAETAGSAYDSTRDTAQYAARKAVEDAEATARAAGEKARRPACTWPVHGTHAACMRACRWCRVLRHSLCVSDC
jgi:Mg-chelatase subunit ChlI